MKYKNVSGSQLHIAENRFLDPGAVVELDEDDVKNPLVKNAIHIKGWLTPLIQSLEQSIEQNVVTGELNHIIYNSNPTNNINVEVNIPIKSADSVTIDNVKQKAIAEAVERAKQQKQQNKKAWNPMNDAIYSDPEGDYLGPQAYSVNGKTEYGSMDHYQVLSADGNNDLPLVHAGADGIGRVGYLLHHPEDVSSAQIQEISETIQETRMEKPTKTTKRTKKSS